MSTKTTNWILRLKEMVSGPLDKIVAKSNAAYGNVAKLEQQFSKLENRASVLSGRLGKLAIGVGVFTALNYGSMQFETGMARANTMAGKGTEQFRMLTDQIREIADIVPLARTELAEGLYQTISNGVPENNWVQFLTDSSKTAIGGLSDLNQVVGVTATIIKNYQDSWENAASIQDKIQKTAVLGKTSFQELGDALPRVTGNAATLGVGLDELLGSFSALTGVSGNTAEVSTQMAAIFTALIKPSAEATKAAQQMGIQFDSLAVKQAGGLSNFITQLTQRTEEYASKTGKSAIEIYGQLFGSAEALRAFIPLSSSVAADFQSKTGQIANAAGTINQAFDGMANTTEVRLQRMQNNWGNFTDGIFTSSEPVRGLLFDIASRVLQLGTSFMTAHPNVTQFALAVGGGFVALYGFLTASALVGVKLQMLHIRMLRAALSQNFFTRMMGKGSLMMLNFVKTLALGSVNLLRMTGRFIVTAVAGISSFVLGLVSATAAQWALNVAMNANPLGLIVIGLMAVIGAIVLVVKYWDNIKTAILDFGIWIIKNHPFAWLIRLVDVVFPGFKDRIKEVFSSVIDWVKKMWDSIKGVFRSVSEWMGFDMSDVEVTVPEGTGGDGAGGTLPPLATIPPGTPPTLSGAGGGSGGGISMSGGGSGGGNVINMTIEVNNNVNAGSGYKFDLERLRDEMTALFVDAGRDALVTLKS